jgi:uncharacterized membrane protein
MAGTLVLAVLLLWLLPLRSSLWLDETGTYWTIKDGLAATFHRALAIQGQSPLYYMLAWLALELGGRNEIVLRLPSTLALVWALVMLYRLGRELFDHRIGLLAATGFALHPGVAFAASDARPYGLALAFTIASVLALVRWLRHGRLRDAASYVLAATAMIYAHYLFGVMLLVHAAYALGPVRPRGPVSRRAFCIAAVLLLLAIVPLTPHVISLARRSADLSFAPEPNLPNLVRVLASTIMPLSILIARDRFRRLGVGSGLPDLILLLCWSAVPPTLLFVVAFLTPAKVFLARYFLAAAPGLALLTAWAVGALDSVRGRIALIAAVAALWITVFAAGDQRDQDWRSAATAVRSLVGSQDTPVLVRSGLIESRQQAWLEGGDTARYLVAPFAFYPVGGTPVPLPWSVDGNTRAYLEDLATHLEQHDRFVLVTNGSPAVFREWLDRRMANLLVTSRPVATFGRVSVVLFERRPP